MADFYEEMQGVAGDLLAEFGEGTVVLVRTTPGEVDPATPWIPGAPTTVTYTLAATVAAVGDIFVDGTTILATDKMVTAAVFGTEPEPGDTLAFDGRWSPS